MFRRSRLLRRGATSALSVLVALAAMLGVSFAGAPPVAACSCAMLSSIRGYARPETVIAAGTVGPSEARGVRFTVDTWFWGANPAPVMWLDQGSFGDGGGDCTIPRPAAATTLLLVGSRNRPVDALSTGMCSPMYDLATPDGQEHLADAHLAFAAAAHPTADPVETPEAAASTGAGEEARTNALLLTGGGILGIALLLFGSVVLIARRRSPPNP